MMDAVEERNEFIDELLVAILEMIMPHGVISEEWENVAQLSLVLIRCDCAVAPCAHFIRPRMHASQHSAQSSQLTKSGCDRHAR